MIIKCDCENKYQDEHYGAYMRVHNAKHDPDKNGYTCTVCGKVNKKNEREK